MMITAEMVPWIVGAAAAVFAFGYAIGHALGKRDGEDRVHRYYESRRRWL